MILDYKYIYCLVPICVGLTAHLQGSNLKYHWEEVKSLHSFNYNKTYKTIRTYRYAD